MEKKQWWKRYSIIGVVFIFFGTLMTPIVIQPGAAIAPQPQPLIPKFLRQHSSGFNGAWLEQATAFSDRNRGIGYISCVNESIVWASAFNGDNPAYPCQDFTKTTDGGATWAALTVPDAVNQYFSMIFALDATTAWAPLYAHQNGVMGIYYTADGGNTWVRQDTAIFSSVYSFPDCVHFWDKNTGWCMGDPAEGYFEIYTTVDGGVTWVRVPQANIPAPLQNEYGLPGSYCVIGDTLWFGTNLGRLYKSPDKGLHWTVSQTPIRSFLKPAFKDETQGLVFDINTVGAPTIAETSDGGITWQSIDFIGPCYNSDLHYVPGTVDMYMSTGSTTGASGVSYSLDGGHTWVDYPDMVGVPLLSLGFTQGKIGWAGSYNIDEFTGGIYKHIPGTPTTAFSITITGGNGLTVHIRNVGDVAATNVACHGIITGGLFITPKTFQGDKAILGVGENFTVTTAPKGIGLGLFTPLPTISVQVNCAEGISTEQTVQAKIFLSKVMIQ
jgi:photosystem II stability/assembly factor-like uncharacterized protein